MKTLIIEDEKAALRNLKAAMYEVDADFEIVGETDSVVGSLEWFATHPMPELVFMDIHLADGAAFGIFEHVDITCPIIFTTAYDEYALRAFKVNSVDYLLKPIDADDLRQALDKLERLGGQKPTAQPDDNYRAILRALDGERNYKSHFLIPAKGDRLIPIETETILYFHIANGQVKAVDDTGREHLFPQTLDELADALDPRLFFRANRQFLIAKRAIREASLWFNGRLSITLSVPTPERIIISKARAAEFKAWF